MLHVAIRIGDQHLKIPLHIDIPLAGIADLLTDQFPDFGADIFIIFHRGVRDQGFHPVAVAAG